MQILNIIIFENNIILNFEKSINPSKYHYAKNKVVQKTKYLCLKLLENL